MFYLNSDGGFVGGGVSSEFLEEWSENYFPFLSSFPFTRQVHFKQFKRYFMEN